MDQDDVLGVYDESYAEAYDERFINHPWARKGVEFELEVLRDLLAGDDPRWLDVGCGTGWVLSQFQGVPRAGLDISPSMLNRARQANPDALFLEQGDFRNDSPDWKGMWSLVSCMWTAYNYVESMYEFDQVLANMVRWAREGGSLFVPVMDLEDLRYVEVDYEEDPEVWSGTIALTGATWTWDEPTTRKRHEHLVAPQIGHFVKLLSPHFERIEVVRYPTVQEGFISRKAVVAKSRRPHGEEGNARVIWHPLPDGAGSPTQIQGTNDSTPAIAPEVIASIHETVGATRGDIATLHAALFPPVEEDRYDALQVTHDQVGALRGDVSALHGLLMSVADQQRALISSEGIEQAPVSLSGVPTRRLGRELAKRVNPVRRLRHRHRT